MCHASTPDKKAQNLRGLTDGRWYERVVGLAAPARRVDVRAVIVHPVVEHIAPAVEVQQHPVRVHLADRRDPDQDRIPPVHSLHLHAHLEPVKRPLWEGKFDKCQDL